MAESATGLCKTVGKGGVGESGATCQIVHQVTGNIQILMLVRTTKTDLCPNTGAVATITVDGVPKAVGSITADGASIQTEANPGDWVVVHVHTVPLFNDIACARLGELYFEVQQCDFE